MLDAYRTMTTPELYEQVFGAGGTSFTWPYRGAHRHHRRSPNDKFIVDEDTSRDKINWDGNVNRALSQENYNKPMT